jgi:hypothetical protein
MILGGGLFGSLIALIMIARRMAEKNVFARILPHLLVLFFFWAGYLFIFTGATGAAPEAAPPAARLSAPGEAGPATALGSTPGSPPLSGAAARPGPWRLYPTPDAATAELPGLAAAGWLRSAQVEPGSGNLRRVLETVPTDSRTLGVHHPTIS